MADRGRYLPSTDNEAVVIENGKGHRVPDTYATGPDSNKFGDEHPSIIHDYYDRFADDAL